MTPTTAQALAALKLACACILEAAQAAGPLGAPSGIVYAAMMEHGMTLDVYETILAGLVQAGRITAEHHLIKLT